ncbi:putative clathrin assembly protein At4g40080 [Ricinus communis]|uniref:putative clathrin assembly protein At4g40080 n=1 Tax=Ricinus communis TaxID=3988 RepID=UPI00201A4091|nr:putative clathrin assembly protein At4g40080 [Ricinus communis]
MGQTKKLRILISFLKDKTSLIKTTLSTKRHSRIHIAVLRATTHDSSAPPSDHRIAAVLSLRHITSHDAASTCIEALMDRLHSTKNAFVALKCLFIMHIIITKGSFILKDQLSIYPSFGGRNFLNLSMFRDELDSERWDLSSWVRWYAAIVEQLLAVSRFLGSPCLSTVNNKDKEKKVSTLLSRDLLSEIHVLLDFVEVISQVPESLHLQRNNLIYEIVRLASDDYRSVQHEIIFRVKELGERIPRSSYSELTQILGYLKRFESFKERLCLLFVNRNRNDALWELVCEIKMKTEEMIKEKGEIKLLKMDGTNDSSRWTRFGEEGFAVVDGGHWTRFS